MRRTNLLLIGLLAVLAGGLAAGCEDGRDEAAGTVTVTVAEVVTETVTTGSVLEPLPTTEAATTEEQETVEESAPVEATVIAVKMGLGQDGRTGNVSYGVVLRNVSPNEDALDVTVWANILARDGRLLAQPLFTIQVIPADTTYYLGDVLGLEPGDVAAGVETMIDVAETAPAAYRLPEVRHVRTPIGEDGLHVRGVVENTLDVTLSHAARVTFVLFDASGSVIGGGVTMLNSLAEGGSGAALPPRQRVAFDAPACCVDAGAVTRARASVEGSVEE